jgi:hypothetical protein
MGLFTNPMGSQRNIFFAGLDNFFADFFNVLHYISERNPYFNPTNGYGEKIYLPLVYLILYPFSRLDEFNTMTLQQAQSSKMGVMAVLLFTMASIFLFFLSLDKIRRKYNIPSYVFVGLCLSYVFIFSMERGNTILLTGAFIAFYLCYYDSDNKKERILAGTCLSLVAIFKIYPVLLGFLYLEKKQYKDICFSATVTLLLAFIPFLFFKGGFSNISQLLNNIKINSEGYTYARLYPRFSLPHLVYYALTISGLTPKLVALLSNIAYAITIVSSGVSVFCSLFCKNIWIKITLLILVVMYLPVNSGWYCGLYLFPSIILFFATLGERPSIFNGFILVVFIVLLNPFQFSITYKNIDFGINYILGNVALLSLWLVLLIAAVKEVVVNRFETKKAVASK